MTTLLGFLRGLAQLIFVGGVTGALAAGGLIGLTIQHFSRDLPDHQQLLSYQPATGTKVFAGDGTQMAEFVAENRIVMPLKDVPPLVVHAFLAAEDRDFYNHGGVNPLAVFRAAVADIVRYQRGQRPLGASTITQQVVRHFLLTNELSAARKIKEALLAYQIESELSKDRILEIYLNEIYLGAGAYGVAAAAQTYFGKPLDRLSLAETAFLAALPKAPNNYNPLHHPQAARTRRDWVLDAMVELGWASAAEARQAKATAIEVRPPVVPGPNENAYFVEEVRRELMERYGEKMVYEGGLTVRTSYVPVYQAMAERAFHNGLVEYDRRHGWRGPVAHVAAEGAAQALAGLADPTGMPGWRLAAVTAIDPGGAQIVLKSGVVGRIPLEEMRWARHTASDQRLGQAVRQVRDVVNPGDIVVVEPLHPDPQPNVKRAPGPSLYGLRQIPDVGGGFVAMDPKTGRVFALIGGWGYQQSQFDRATQAKRQPGSSIKPFVYVTALATGDYTPSSTVLDAPIEIDQGPGLPKWTPANYEGNYVGNTTLRQALVHSRNLATARLATQIGLPAIAQTVQQFGIMDKMPLYYSMALGAGDTTLLRMTTGYSMLDNGGHWLRQSMIDLVQDRNGRIIYQKGTRSCAACYVLAGPRNAPDTDPNYRAVGAPDASVIYLKDGKFADKPLFYKPIKADPLVDPIADRQIVSMMEGVVQHGTGIKVAAVGKPLAGKTGTSSDWFDAWFVGFSPDIAAGVYVGFDTPRTLGGGETGGNVAAPIFRDFMAAALKDAPALPFPEATGADMVLVNAVNGQATYAGDKDAVLEAFRPGTAPTRGGGSEPLWSQPADESEPQISSDTLPARPGLPGAAMPGTMAAPYPMADMAALPAAVRLPPGVPAMAGVPAGMAGMTAMPPGMPTGISTGMAPGMPPGMPTRSYAIPVRGMPGGGTGGLY